MAIRIDRLLGAAWIAGTLPILVASLPISKLNHLHQLLLGFAKRGKIMKSSSNKFTVPQRFFLHFYALGFVWTTFLLVITWNYASQTAPLVPDPLDFSTAASHLIGGGGGGSRLLSLHKTHSRTAKHRYQVWVSVFLLLLMESHVLRRLYETIYVFKYSPSARMHVLGYLTGLFFYAAAPLSLCHFCALEALNFAADEVVELNAKSKQGDPSFIFGNQTDWRAFVKPILKLGWCQWGGALVFFWGWVHQHRCHQILGSLRRKRREQTDDYVIPGGDWFELVSSPHYLAEMVCNFTCPSIPSSE
ncbi:Polyprenol reductase 2 [Linum grandiflorum]